MPTCAYEDGVSHVAFDISYFLFLFSAKINKKFVLFKAEVEKRQAILCVETVDVKNSHLLYNSGFSGLSGPYEISCQAFNRIKLFIGPKKEFYS